MGAVDVMADFPILEVRPHCGVELLALWETALTDCLQPQTAQAGNPQNAINSAP